MSQELSVSQALARRRAARRYLPEPVERAALIDILDQTRLTPSGFNMQPVHFVLVTDPEAKRRLRRACMDQKQVEEAAAAVVFAADLHPHRGRLESILSRDLEAGAIDSKYASFSGRVVRLFFEGGPLGLVGRLKAAAFATARLFRPMLQPALTRRQREIWSIRQAAMAAQTFLLLAAARDLDTCPMEGFDPWRVRRTLGIPRRYVPALVVTVGRAVPFATPRRVRVPLPELLHENRF
jgi:putative NAD(P)H nitroreductase